MQNQKEASVGSNIEDSRRHKENASHRGKLPVSDAIPNANWASERFNTTKKVQFSDSRNSSMSHPHARSAASTDHGGLGVGSQSHAHKEKRLPDVSGKCSGPGASNSSSDSSMSSRPGTILSSGANTSYENPILSSELCMPPKQAHVDHAFEWCGTLCEDNDDAPCCSSFGSPFMSDDVYEFERPADAYGPCIHNIMGITESDDVSFNEAASHLQKSVTFSPTPSFHMSENPYLGLTKRMSSSDKLNWGMLHLEDDDAFSYDRKSGMEEQSVSQPKTEAIRTVLFSDARNNQKENEGRGQGQGLVTLDSKRRKLTNDSSLREPKRITGRNTS